MSNNTITFHARPGDSIILHANKKFGKNQQMVKKYVNCYENLFSADLDKSTIVDLDTKRNYVFYSKIFPGIEYTSDIKLNTTNDLLQSFLMESPKTLSKIEFKFFRKIISTSIKLGKSIQDLSDAANGITNEKSKKSFLYNLNLAKYIIKENPKSELLNSDFEIMHSKLIKDLEDSSEVDFHKLFPFLDTKN